MSDVFGSTFPTVLGAGVAMPPDVLGDAGEAFRLWALTRVELVDLVEDRVGIALQGPLPAIRYAVVGGPVGRGEAQALLQVEGWGHGDRDDDGTALAITNRVVAAVPALRGPWGGSWVAGANPESLPFRSDDRVDHRPRYITTVRLHLYALEGPA